MRLLCVVCVLAATRVDAAPRTISAKKEQPKPKKMKPAAKVEPARPEPEPVKAPEPMKPEPVKVETVEEVSAPIKAPPPVAERPLAPLPPNTDHSARGAMKGLATSIAERFRAAHGDVAFHRVAVPYFKNGSPASEKEKVGQLAAELLAVELQQQRKFVVVERERLDQLMKEHRLKDLGVVDEGSAAEFGKVLGAQSLILGTVSESGADYVVTVRQVDAEKGVVLVSAQVSLDRAGLLAISSDAIETRSRLGAGLRSALVPGWGQIYNKEPVKGALFLSAAIAVLGTGIGFFVASTLERNRYALNQPETVSARDRANLYITVANGLSIAYGVVWAAAIIDALVSGKDYTTFEVKSEATTLSF